MRSLFLVIVFCISAGNSFAQTHTDTLERQTTGEYNKGREGHLIITYARPETSFHYEPGEGLNLIYRKDGSLYMKGTYKFDADSVLIKTDTFSYFYSDGQLRDKGIYSENERAGSWKHYSPDGELEYEQDYTSLIRTYFYPDGSKRAAGKMKAEKIEQKLRSYLFFDLTEHEGVWQFFYPDGTCECKGQVVSNLKHGKWVYNRLKNGVVRKETRTFRLYVADYNYTFLEHCMW